MKKNSSFPTVLTVKDIQEILSIGRKQSYDLIHSQQFKTLKIGGSYRIPAKNFFDWLYNESA